MSDRLNEIGVPKSETRVAQIRVPTKTLNRIVRKSLRGKKDGQPVPADVEVIGAYTGSLDDVMLVVRSETLAEVLEDDDMPEFAVSDDEVTV